MIEEGVVGVMVHLSSGSSGDNGYSGSSGDNGSSGSSGDNGSSGNIFIIN